ncbi:Endonuclease-reverse transcriptase [Operophtera brumata]|uniref:Endonuclease-reverse transcriptase n=1 Tax=Operophtera brumata TaxID=104452 RepID=A0A0L7LIQ6_OPEBR|nr:Endonuclease-reverse transcriptase [Operophtera brumata]
MYRRFIVSEPLKKRKYDLCLLLSQTKEVLEKRRELLPKLKEERAKGNFAYIRYDQLIRDPSTSPEIQNYAKKLVSNISSIKGNRRNEFDMVRPRSNSLSQVKPNQSNNQKRNNPNPAGPRGFIRPPPPINASLSKNRKHKIYLATLNVRKLMEDHR